MDINYNCLKTWDESIHRLYESKEYSDITFVAEFNNESTSFPAHKLILAMSSPMFAEMFCDPNSASPHHIILSNVEQKVVELMLCHIYYRKEVQFESLEQCFGVLSLATTYELSILRKMCTNYIDGYIDVAHVCSVYETAISVRNRNLALKSFQFIQKETKNILNQPSWKKALPVTVKTVVKQKYLNIDAELQLFEAVLSWAKSRIDLYGVLCSDKRLRQEIEPFLPYFRFFSMNTETFLKIAASTQIFTNDEIAAIAMNFVKRNSVRLPDWFDHNPRCRSYEYQTSDDETFRDNWFNVNKKVYSHSERVEKVSSVFRAKDNDFSIHQLLIAICDDCYAHNTRSKRPSIKVKVTLKVDTTVREIVVDLPMNYCVEYRRALNFDKSAPILLARSVSGNFTSPKSVGMESHSFIVQQFLDPDCSRLRLVTGRQSSTLSQTIDLEPPVLVQSEERFELSLETVYKDERHFFCCKKMPTFEDTPFTAHTRIGQKSGDEVCEVWCAFASMGYSLSKEDRVLCE